MKNANGDWTKLNKSLPLQVKFLPLNKQLISARTTKEELLIKSKKMTQKRKGKS